MEEARDGIMFVDLLRICKPVGQRSRDTKGQAQVRKYLDTSADAPSRLNHGYRPTNPVGTHDYVPLTAQAFSKRCPLDPRFGTKCRK